MLSLEYPKAHFLKTLVFALFIFVLMIGACEEMLSHPALREQLPVPDFGTQYDPMEDYVLMLDVFSADHDGVECVILGTSMSRTGIQPEYFSEGYERRSGQPISCFNAGISGMTASSAALVAQYIVDHYHPKLLIYATAFIDYDQNRQPFEEEEMFPQSHWASYWSGKFSMEGFLLNDLRSYGYLKAFPGVLQTGKLWTLQDLYDSTVEGFAPRAWFYANRSPTLDILLPNTYPLDTIQEGEFALSDDDYDGLQQIISLKDQGVELIMIEMPAYLTPEEWQTANTPEDKVGWYTFSQVIVPEVRDSGIPFWTTTDLEIIPPTGWNDRLHLFFGETPAFSVWLGEQLGEATSQGIFTDDPPSELLLRPPLDILPTDPDPQRQERLGLSTKYYQMFQDYRAAFDLIPPDATVFIPEHGLLSRDFLLNTLGAYIEWAFRFGTIAGEPDSASNSLSQSTLFNLMVVLSDMKYAEDLTLDASQQQALNNWRESKLPQGLHAINIDYILYGDLWFSWLSQEQADVLKDPQNYELVTTLIHPAVRQPYYLYRVLDGEDD